MKLDLNEIQKSLARKSFKKFVAYTKKDYEFNWHHDLLCKKLEDFALGKIKRLMIFVPPRHGKSELTSRRLPAWIFGINPNARIISTSYSAELSSSFNRDVQRIIDDPLYAEVFPKTYLNSKNVRSDSNSKWIRNNDVFEIVDHKGMYRCAGVGGAITGTGGDFCFIAGTSVITSSGYKNIEDIKIGEKVLSYNESTRQLEYKPVKKLSSRIVSDLVSVKTTGGSEIICTPNHPFYIFGKGYREAKDIENSWELISARLPKSKNFNLYFRMRLLSFIVRKKKSRLSKNIKKRLQRFLLFKSMLKKSSLNKKQKTLQHLQSKNRKQASKILQVLQNKYDWWKQKSVSKNLLFNKAVNISERLFSVCYLFFKKNAYCSPYRRIKDKQQTGKLNNFLQILSHKTPQKKSDFIREVKRVNRGKIHVYDFEVEGNHNFFAEGILVHNCIIDDPIKNYEEAKSATMRRRVVEWYSSTLYTRQEKDAGILIVQTRWHESDLSGYLLEKSKLDSEFSDEWEVLSLPALSNGETEHDQRKNIDEPLWENKYNYKWLMTTKNTLGSFQFSALYQQNPTPDEGSFVKLTWIKKCAIAPDHFQEIIQSWDMSFGSTSETASFVVGSVYGRIGSSIYLIDQVRGQWNFSETIAQFKRMVQKHPKATRKLVERKANGQAVIDSLRLEVQGIIPIDPIGSKESRLASCQPMYEAGNIFYVEAPYIDDHIDEIVSFPNGKFNDRVDTESQALNYFRQKPAGRFDDQYSDLKSSGFENKKIEW